MARFVVGEPIKTRKPVIEVDAGLEPGVHLFQLEVVDAEGNVSKPDVASVTVTERADPRDPLREPIVTDRVLRVDEPLDPTDLVIRRPDDPQ